GRRLGLGPPRARGPAANPSPGPRRIRERGQCPERLGQGLRVSRGIFGKGDGTCRFSTPTERGNNRCGHGWTWLRVFACGVRFRVLYIWGLVVVIVAREQEILLGLATRLE